MRLSTSRAGRSPLAHLVATLFAFSTLGACADDEQPMTAPPMLPNAPSLAIGDVITVTNARGGGESGSLRWAVAQTTGGEIIRFDPRLAGSTITLDSTLVIANPITIEGPTDKGITLNGGGRGRVIDLPVNNSSSSPTTLRNLSVTGGKLTTDAGAGIRAAHPLILAHSTVWGNESVYAPAIQITNAVPLTLVNSTVSGNVATQPLNAAIWASGAVTIDNSTIAYNPQGGVRVGGYPHEATLRNAIIAHNGIANCNNTDEYMRHDGTNLSTNISCGESSAMLIADPKLENLRDNGGPSMTHALAPESPAFNAAGLCALTVDQRYEPRDASCDIGAFESSDVTTVALTMDRLASVNPTGSNAVVVGTVKCSRGGDTFAVAVQIEQRASDRTLVTGSGRATVTCTTADQPWSILVTPSAGTFRSGNASATATTEQTPSWVAPGTASRSMKLVAPDV
jgi:hypothetical protein